MTVTETVKDTLGMGEQPCKSTSSSRHVRMNPIYLRIVLIIGQLLTIGYSGHQGADVRGATSDPVPR